MKKLALGLLLLLVFLPPGSLADSTSPLLPAAMDASEAPYRVYGEDLSSIIFAQVTVDSYRNYIRTLTENGSRWVQTPSDMSWQNHEAREYIIEELDRVSDGRIETEIIGEWQSVVGRLPGYLPVDAPGILVGGHYDSVPAAPGANDDGTGVAMMLELARVMSQYSWPLDIYFGAWNAEEIGLLGSAEVADEFRTRGIDLLVHYNVDMLLVSHPDRPSYFMVYPVGYYQDGRYWAELTQMMSMHYGDDLSVPTQSSDFPAWQRSDHWSFIQRGFEASLFAHESGGAYDTAYHTSRDSWTNELYDYDIATDAVKSIGAAIAYTMSRAYQQRTQLEYSFTLLPSHTRQYYIPITLQTTLEVDCRWWGGGTSLRLFAPNGQQVAQHVSEDSSPWELSTVIEESVGSQGLYRLEITNVGGTSVGHDVTVSFETDVDRTGVADSQEFWFDQSYFSSDQDNDSISDAEEMILGTDRYSSDTDLDSLPDSWEVANDLDPLDPADANQDQDGDGLTAIAEYENGCDPWSEDTDSDCMPDAFEVAYGLDPTVDDAGDDLDSDGISNLREYQQGTNPALAERRLGIWVLPVAGVAIAGVVVTVVALKNGGP